MTMVVFSPVTAVYTCKMDRDREGDWIEGVLRPSDSTHTKNRMQDLNLEVVGWPV